eukprot:g26661.t1
MPNSAEIQPVNGPIQGTIVPPGSKSLTNRALLVAALARGVSKLTGLLDSRDTQVMISALRSMGINIENDPVAGTATIFGCSGAPPASVADIDIENSGTSIRFLTAFCALGDGEFRLDGNERMRQRPIEDLAVALNELGGDVVCSGETLCPPVHIRGRGLEGGTTDVAGTISSQYLSGLLMAAPCARTAVELNVAGELVSKPYIDMTLGVMRVFGVSVDAGSLERFRITPQKYRGTDYDVEPDASAASYFFAAAAITGGEVTVTGLSKSSLQGDVHFVDVLEQMGCEVQWQPDAITVRGGTLRGVDVDMNAISDTAQTLAAVAVFAEGPTRITNIAHVRHKETDRIAAVATELRRLGITVDEADDGLTIHPSTPQAAEVFAGKLLDRFRAANSDIETEFRLATELVYGVIRRQSTLNALIDPHVTRPRHKIEGPLWSLLQLGAYQLVFTDAIPEHAAVNETVSVANRFGNRGWTGFVNGVLRSLSRDVSNTFVEHPAANAVPLNAGRYRQLSRDVFADPEIDPARYFARAFSFPQWVAARWASRFSFHDLTELGFWFDAPPGITLRVNRLLTTREDVLESLHRAEISADRGDLPWAIHLHGSVSIPRLPGFEEGHFIVQDESAMRVAEALDPQPGESILDLCAAPGTKTTHIAELMQNQGRVVATDIKPDRLSRVAENAKRLRLEIVETRQLSDDLSDIPDGPFDRVLVDVPCSNTGVLAKRPEARWRLDAKALAELAMLQKRLLMAACDSIKPNGRIVYSTCSIEPEENGELVRGVLEGRAGFRLADEATLLPGRPADGGYYAVIEPAVT